MKMGLVFEEICRKPFDGTSWRSPEDINNAVAHTNLGVMLLFGRGTNQDPVRASKLFRVAADQGDARAQYFLGTAYEKGLGVRLNTAEAVRLYKLSADQGNEQAAERLSAINDPDFRKRRQEISKAKSEIDRLDRRVEYSWLLTITQMTASKPTASFVDNLFQVDHSWGALEEASWGTTRLENPDSSISRNLSLSNTSALGERLTGEWEDEFGRGKVELTSLDSWRSFQGRWFVRENNGSYTEKGSWDGKVQNKQTLVSLFQSNNDLSPPPKIWLSYSRDFYHL